jgi:hypothetical protein
MFPLVTSVDPDLAGGSETSQRPSRAYLFVIALIVIAGIGIVATAYWPGVMIDDTRWQYQQVVDHAFEDWHPPLMAWIWSRLALIAPGPAPMLVLQLVLYWTGIALIACWAWRRGTPRLAVAIAAAGWLPACFALTGTVLKDVLMAGFLLCAVGLLLCRTTVRGTAARQAMTALSILAIFASAALRFNAFFACLPLLLAALPTPFTRTGPRLAATVIAATAALMMSGPAVAALVHAEKTGVDLSLIIFDLGGITEHAGVSQFPDLGVQNPVAVNHRCYDPYEWDSYSDWAKKPCPLGFDRFQAFLDNEDVNARMLWVHAIASHPIAYAQHRLTHFNLSTWFIVPEGPAFTAWSQSVPNPWGFHIRPNAIVSLVGGTADAAAATPLGLPFFWISVALAALIAGLATEMPTEVRALAASAFLYGAAYLVVGVATGVRYYFWTFTGAALAVLVLAVELRSRRLRVPNRPMTAAIGVVALPTLIAMAARLAL